jgi:hypothetical protein
METEFDKALRKFMWNKFITEGTPEAYIITDCAKEFYELGLKQRN